MMMRSFTPVVALLGIGRLQRWAGTPEQDGGSGSGRPGSLRGPVVGAGVGERSGWAVHGWSGTGLGPARGPAGRPRAQPHRGRREPATPSREARAPRLG